MKKKIVISCLGVGFQLKNQNEEIVEESSTILSGDSETEKKHVFLIKTVKR